MAKQKRVTPTKEVNLKAYNTYRAFGSQIDQLMVLVSTVGIVSSFINVFKFADKSQPGNAVFAAVSVACFALLLASTIARSRRYK